MRESEREPQRNKRDTKSITTKGFSAFKKKYTERDAKRGAHIKQQGDKQGETQRKTLRRQLERERKTKRER